MGASLPPKEANLFKLIVVHRCVVFQLFCKLERDWKFPNSRVDASKAIEILEAYEGTLEDDYPPENERCEHGEMLLYKVDKLAYKEQEVSLLVKLAHLEEGEKLYRKLLSMNPDNYRYYEGLQKCVGLYSENGHYSLDEIDQLDALYRTLGQQYKWSSAVKADILEQIILEIESSIKTTSQYPGGMEKEPPSTLMWTLFLLAQHYDRRGQYEIALSKINEAIDHTPTVIDLYSVKSRILKHAGDLVAAAAFADEARCMDLADRYVNSECVKRMLQADQVALAEKTAVLFTKDGDQHNNLHDMQCMWYELAGAESYFRQGNLGMALKKFLSVEKHYADITEDQFDFHSYCLRKMTLHTYVEMLKFQDQLHSHAYFHKAAAGAISCRCYIELHDSPPKLTTEEDNDLSKLLPSQKKKMRQKQRKAEARAKKEAEEKNEESSAGGISKSGKRHAKPVDPDPCGEKLLQVEDPLLEATKYLKLLQKNSPDSLETHFLSFELYMRKQRILLAFQAVKQLLRLDAEHPDSHRCLIKFFNKVGSMIAPVTDSEKLIWSVLEAERQTIRFSYSLTHRAAFGETLYILDPNRRSEAVKLIEGSPNNIVPTNGVLGPIREWKLIDCVAVHKLLGTVLVDQDAALRWKVRCAELFPYSTYFEGSRSSASPNSAFNQIRKSSENGSSNHSVGDHNAESGTSNGKLEAFKDLTI
ncbi:hypothetical protein JHK85_041753 [Glycine max]|nr:hypothetical protein JHK85_041753 [Glycine max]